MDEVQIWLLQSHHGERDPAVELTLAFRQWVRRLPKKSPEFWLVHSMRPWPVQTGLLTELVTCVHPSDCEQPSCIRLLYMATTEGASKPSCSLRQAVYQTGPEKRYSAGGRIPTESAGRKSSRDQGCKKRELTHCWAFRFRSCLLSVAWQEAMAYLWNWGERLRRKYRGSEKGSKIPSLSRPTANS